jgi:hypothetical protein
MSGQNKDDENNFLSRWSQRKQQAKQPTRDAPAAEGAVPSKPLAESAVEPEFDLSSLPKLEDLTETTDITAFLRKGVPESVRNAALRKSWALDPAIRNYVNPALEYAYDWNTPGGVPGNGEIEAGVDIARMVSQIMGDGESVFERASPAGGPDNEPASPSEDSATQKPEPELAVQTVRLTNETSSPELLNAEQGERATDPAKHSAESRAAAPHHEVRRHGSAKPRV